jgi:hypothetical protein
MAWFADRAKASQILPPQLLNAVQQRESSAVATEEAQQILFVPKYRRFCITAAIMADSVMITPESGAAYRDRVSGHFPARSSFPLDSDRIVHSLSSFLDFSTYQRNCRKPRKLPPEGMPGARAIAQCSSTEA